MLGTISKMTDRWMKKLPPWVVDWGTVFKNAVAAWAVPFVVLYPWIGKEAFPILAAKTHPAHKQSCSVLYLAFGAPLVERALHSVGGGNASGALVGLIFFGVNLCVDCTVILPTLRLISNDDGAIGTAARESGILALSFSEYYETIMPCYLPILVIGWCSGRLLVAAGADAYAPQEVEQVAVAPPAKGQAGSSAKASKKKAA